MEKDFYLHERALAGYVEKDWFDHILSDNSRKPAFTFAPFETRFLGCDHHQRMVEFLSQALDQRGFRSKSLLEIGSSLGRTFFEVCKHMKSLERATLVEPSLNLHRTFNTIFRDEGVARLPILKGNLETDEVTLETKPIRAECSHVQLENLNIRFQDFAQSIRQFDLTICANVLDQCADHMQLVELLKSSVAPGGALLLSCTYQWNDKYIGNAGEIIRDINDLFDSRWNLLDETNLPFQIRINERYWMTFLSHLVIYQKF